MYYIMSVYIYITIALLVLIGTLVGAYFYFKDSEESEEETEEVEVDFEKEFATCKTEKEASITASKLLQEKIDEKEKEILAEKERCEKAVEEGVSTETQAKADLQEKIDAATKELDVVKAELQKHVALAEIRKNLASCSYKVTEDGRLVIHDKDGKEVWSTPKPTTGTGPFKLVAQDDGNLVIYDKDNKAVWGSGTIQYSGNRKAPYKLVLEEDCRLVLVGSDNIGVWRSPQPVSPAMENTPVVAAEPVVEKFSQLMLKLASPPGNTQLAYSSFKEISTQPVL